MANLSHELFPMNAGDGPNSYTNNSAYQREGLNVAKAMIDEAIAKKLDIQHSSSSSNPFTIADFGSSTGPNTFVVVENIINAVELKYKQQCSSLISSHVPEFQVYFNDHLGNDFNTLFTAIPPKKQYFAAGVPGSFYGRLFPKASLDFAHSSYALHWMSMVPKEVQDRNSPAWNKGRISYGSAPEAVVKAYAAQYAKDMGSFLQARAEELVPGGLIALLLIASPDKYPKYLGLLDLMGSSLMDMANMGIISEASVDSFNLPLYNTTYEELKSLVENNGCFTIEEMKPLYRPGPDPESCATHLRAGGFEQVFKEHFGSAMLDDFFQRFATKVAESGILSKSTQESRLPNELFVLLKRKSY